MKVLFVKASDFYNDVRVTKYAKVLHSEGHTLDFVGWQRVEKEQANPYFNKLTYIQKGYGFNNKWLIFGYFFWMIRLFFKALFFPKYDWIYVVDFECAFPVRLANIFRRQKIVYDIYDEFAIRYKLPGVAKWIIQEMDYFSRRGSHTVIHVDESRVSPRDKKYIIIENSPMDYYENRSFKVDIKPVFAVTGWMTDRRGTESIYKFLMDHSEYKFLVIGNITDPEMKKKYLAQANVEYHDMMPQDEVFERTKDCAGIFALYDPSVEINRKAASNKSFDALMLGKILITNEGILMAEKVKSMNIGLVVNYDYDASWNKIVGLMQDEKRLHDMCIHSRELYETGYEFSKLLKNRLLNKL